MRWGDLSTETATLGPFNLLLLLFKRTIFKLFLEVKVSVDNCFTYFRFPHYNLSTSKSWFSWNQVCSHYIFVYITVPLSWTFFKVPNITMVANSIKSESCASLPQTQRPNPTKLLHQFGEIEKANFVNSEHEKWLTCEHSMSF